MVDIKLTEKEAQLYGSEVIALWGSTDFDGSSVALNLPYSAMEGMASSGFNAEGVAFDDILLFPFLSVVRYAWNRDRPDRYEVTKLITPNSKAVVMDPSTRALDLQDPPDLFTADCPLGVIVEHSVIRPIINGVQHPIEPVALVACLPAVMPILRTARAPEPSSNRKGRKRKTAEQAFCVRSIVSAIQHTCVEYCIPLCDLQLVCTHPGLAAADIVRSFDLAIN